MNHPEQRRGRSGSPGWLESPLYFRGLELLNQGHYFEAHEVLEDLWRPTRGHARQFLQGLIQVAVALHHYSTGNLEGALSVMRRAGRNLSPYDNDFGSLDVAGLRNELEDWHHQLQDGRTRLPRLKVKLLSRR